MEHVPGPGFCDPRGIHEQKNWRKSCSRSCYCSGFDNGNIFFEITRLIWCIHTVSKSLFDVRSAGSHVYHNLQMIRLAVIFDGQRFTIAVSLSYSIEFVSKDGVKQPGEA